MISSELQNLKFNREKKKHNKPCLPVAPQHSALIKLIQMPRFRSAIYCRGSPSGYVCVRGLGVSSGPDVATPHKTRYDFEKQLGALESFLVSDLEDGQVGAG